jgi:hypothetical protein
LFVSDDPNCKTEKHILTEQFLIDQIKSIIVPLLKCEKIMYESDHYAVNDHYVVIYNNDELFNEDLMFYKVAYQPNYQNWPTQKIIISTHNGSGHVLSCDFIAIQSYNIGFMLYDTKCKISIKSVKNNEINNLSNKINNYLSNKINNYENLIKQLIEINFNIDDIDTYGMEIVELIKMKYNMCPCDTIQIKFKFVLLTYDVIEYVIQIPTIQNDKNENIYDDSKHIKIDISNGFYCY